jgi:putative membrane protein
MVMMKRLWFGITWPSALITLVLGLVVLFNGGWADALVNGTATWLWIKLVLVVLLYLYHFSLHIILRKFRTGILPYSSNQLRMWNEVATVFLIAIVMLATVKQSISLVWGLAGLVLLILLLLAAIRLYRRLREQ